MSDTRGRVVFTDVPAGTYPLVTEHIAYGAQHDSLRIPADAGVVDLTIQLASRAIRLDGITAEARSRRATRLRVRSSSAAHVVMADEIQALAPSAAHVGDVIRATIPNLQVREVWVPAVGSVAMRKVLCIESNRRVRSLRASGCEPALVVIDDVRIPLDDGPHRLRELSPHEIESIEFVPPVQAGVRYGTGGGNGAIVIHTIGSGPWKSH